MIAKTLFVTCAQILFIQSISAQCIGAALPVIAAAPCAAGLGTAGLGLGAIELAPAARGLAASNGPGLAVVSASPVPPVGVSVASDNAIEGALAVAGALPLLGTVGLEGVLPTVGAGAVTYNCASGLIGITAEDIAAAPLGLAGPLGIGAPLALGGPLGVAEPLGLAAPLGLGIAAGPIGLGGPLGCGYGIL